MCQSIYIGFIRECGFNLSDFKNYAFKIAKVFGKHMLKYFFYQIFTMLNHYFDLNSYFFK
jgi:hypothetical protein